MEKELLPILDKIMGTIFGFKNPYTIDQFIQKYAFDVRLPKQTNDSITGEVTWAQSLAPQKFITMKNAFAEDAKSEWLIPKRPLANMEDILAAWQQTNLMATERQIEAINAVESDMVYNSENVYRSQDIHFSKNVAFCDGVKKCEFVAASQRSHSNTYSLRIEDSQECSNSFNVIWSGKISNSFFIQDCYDMFECMFCSHMRSKRFCIANMQFEEEEYKKIKAMVIQWILTA